jgi:1-phosphofructokinase family hexose kinase
VIVCVGTTPVWQRSMVFERVHWNDVSRAVYALDYASGKSINVARVLDALGESVRAVGFAGGDTGKAILRDLRRARIRRDFVRVHRPTRQCITVIDRSTGTATELVEEAARVPEEDWQRLDMTLAKWLPRARGVVLSGSLPAGGPHDFYLSCLRKLRPGTPTILDARSEPLLRAVPHGGFIAKLNRDELGTTIGMKIDSDERLRRAIPRVLPPGGWVVVTAGAEGAVVASADAAWRVHPPRIKAKSGVGSGDAFAAGMMFKLVDGAPIHEAAGYGAACGAANALNDLAGCVKPPDVDELLPQVRVEPF